MSTLKVNAVTDTTGLLPPVFPAGSAQLNPLANREDKIINGDFGVWQRGTSHSTLGYGSADRWYNSLVGGTVTQSRQAFTLGDTLGVNSPTYFMRQSVSGQTLASHSALTQHLVESVRSYAGQTITVLGWARRSSAGDMAVEAQQAFGTGGSPSANVNGISPTTVALTTSFAPFAVTLTVPSITGKTLGANNNDVFVVNFWVSAGSDYNARTNSLGLQTTSVDLWGIHIRQGTWTAAATADYRPRDPGTELALCQRYYRTGTVYGWGYTNVGSVQRVAASHYPTMRGIPAGALTGISTFGGSGGTIEQINSNSIGVTMTAASAGGFGLTATYTADAEL